jgi:RNA recognition motif-containing protein
MAHEKHSVHVKNLPLDVDEKKIEERFREFGPVKDVYVAYPETTS